MIYRLQKKSTCEILWHGNIFGYNISTYVTDNWNLAGSRLIQMKNRLEIKME